MSDLNIEELFKKFQESEHGSESVDIEQFKNKREILEFLLGSCSKVPFLVAKALTSEIKKSKPDFSNHEIGKEVGFLLDGAINIYASHLLNNTLIEIDKSIFMIYVELKEANTSFHSIAESLAALVLLNDKKNE